jgi:hypothetical protein
MNIDDLFNDSYLDDIKKHAEDNMPPEKPKKGSKPRPEPKQRIENHGGVAFVEKEVSPDEDPALVFAINKCNQEFHDIIAAWNAFTDVVKGMAIGKYMKAGIGGFEEHMNTIIKLINTPIDVEKLSSSGVEGYKLLTKKKAEIFADIFNKYADEFEEEI